MEALDGNNTECRCAPPQTPENPGKVLCRFSTFDVLPAAATYHDAHAKALVDELELKLEQDERLVKEVGERLREECCERQACQSDFASMKKAIQERAALHQKMLLNRQKQHETLQRSNAASTQRLSEVRVLRCVTRFVWQARRRTGSRPNATRPSVLPGVDALLDSTDLQYRRRKAGIGCVWERDRACLTPFLG